MTKFQVAGKSWIIICNLAKDKPAGNYPYDY